MTESVGFQNKVYAIEQRTDQFIKNWNSLVGILTEKNVLTPTDLVRIWQETK